MLVITGVDGLELGSSVGPETTPDAEIDGAEEVVVERPELGCVVGGSIESLLMPVAGEDAEEVWALGPTSVSDEETTGAAELDALGEPVGSGEGTLGIVSTVPEVAVLTDDPRGLPLLLDCGPVTGDGRVLKGEAGAVVEIGPGGEVIELMEVAVDRELDDSRLVSLTIETVLLDEDAAVGKGPDPVEDAGALERCAVDCELTDSRLVSLNTENEAPDVE